MSKSLPRSAFSRPKTARELGIMQGFPPPPEKRPTLENWDLPPFNRWSFQNVRSLIPTAEVHRSEGPASILPEQKADLGAIEFETEDGNSKTIEASLQDTYTDGFLVMHRGKVVTELYFNDMTATRLHLAQSVSKSLVGTLAGILIHEGFLDPQRPLADIVPELAPSGFADATARHLLDMTSGVRFIEDYGHPDSDMTRIDVASGWRPPHRGRTPETIRDVIITLPKVREHGQRFDYRSIETDVLAWTLERATGQLLVDLLSQYIWGPLGAERDAYFTVDSAGTALADGGFNACLRDYARFGLMMLNGGELNQRRIVPAAWVEDCRSGDHSKFGDIYRQTSPNGAYRNKWWINDIARGDFMARGVFGQMIYIDPEADFMAVKLSTWPDYLIPTFTRETLRSLVAIRQELAAT
ncbi:serine hydrolase domain-containing protein [Limibacillus halophilus]|uniref:CubicO group peptidase (Beta-lactamase class C family) n=1 Tax=Limibacillus halophilus TaxID=1579333 RepID=A0A839SMV3_9PROT|nr:serine hydrolase [Limibacillus halophilus]MBB3064151.1 CubicO group peptidase (beta-lactamase class C family) [Limibacillus halophilus]